MLTAAMQTWMISLEYEEYDSMGDSKATVRKCKRIRDRIYDREQFAGFILRRQVLKLISPESIIVDVGCGRKASFLRSISSRVKKAYGIDLEIPETSIEGNLELIRGDADALPLSDSSADAVTMIDVAEHLDPMRVFLECKRVLKPGGSLILVAPCKFYPPIILGRAMSHRLRQMINAIVTRMRSEDTYPSYYRANSAGDLTRLAKAAGLDPICIEYFLYHPLYCMFSTLVYRSAVAVERTILKMEAFAFLRHQIFCQLKKPEKVD